MTFASLVAGPVEAIDEASDCEAVRDGILGQPANTVTSLAFVAVGVVVLQTVRRRGLEDVPRRVFGWLLVATGLGSAIYHGPHPPGARFVHDLPIIGLIVFMVFVEVSVRRSGERWPLPRETTIALVVCTVAGAASWLFGRTGSPLCDPDGIVQLHAQWHLFAAASLGLWSLRLPAPD